MKVFAALDQGRGSADVLVVRDPLPVVPSLFFQVRIFLSLGSVSRGLRARSEPPLVCWQTLEADGAAA